MEVIFADAFFFIALLNEADAHHADAIHFMVNNRARLLTTDYVLVETCDAVAETKQRKKLESFVRFLLAPASIEVIQGDRSLFLAGLDFLSRRLDKQWSLTDCISFVVMKQRGITEALTHDHHFKQAGFRVLL
jgi:predicted nucleic acid-binding protein